MTPPFYQKCERCGIADENVKRHPYIGASGNNDYELFHETCDPKIVKIHDTVAEVREEMSQLIRKLDKVL